MNGYQVIVLYELWVYDSYKIDKEEEARQEGSGTYFVN